jgi:hypothetical protein
MDKIHLLSISEPPHVCLDFFFGDFSLQREQAVEPEDGVIEITFAGPVREPAIASQLPQQKTAHELGGIFEDSWGESSHLEHL